MRKNEEQATESINPYLEINESYLEEEDGKVLETIERVTGNERSYVNIDTFAISSEPDLENIGRAFVDEDCIIIVKWYKPDADLELDEPMKTFKIRYVVADADLGLLDWEVM